MAEEKVWCGFTGTSNMQFYATVKEGHGTNVEASVMYMRDGKWRWNIRLTGETGLEDTEELAKEKALEMLAKKIEGPKNESGNSENQESHC